MPVAMLPHDDADGKPDNELDSRVAAAGAADDTAAWTIDDLPFDAARLLNA